MEKEIICTVCGYTGNPIKIAKGNIFIEILLWLFFIIPGLIYSLWRFFFKYPACPKCKKYAVISLDSPMGQKLRRELNVSP